LFLLSVFIEKRLQKYTLFLIWPNIHVPVFGFLVFFNIL